MVHPTPTITLTPTQIQIAQKLGVPLHEFARHYSTHQSDMQAIEEEYAVEEEPEFDPNNDPVYSASIEALKNMWAARFGTRWVRRTAELEDNEGPWANITSRLRDYDLLEDDHTCEWLKLREER